MESLSKMQNIGDMLEQKLKEVGIETPGDLKRIGSKEAFKRIRGIDTTACINMLYALEGAVEGKRWHYLSEEKKQNLKEFYKTVCDGKDL
ncbi:MAG: TfoX/Sxy family protein [Clostridia bacterium]|nr:TfoX/Sxy family protein [Clostridia bacterium]